ncbi:hypothetical protein EIN_187930 [Entamoeba invadens IP1]|uniref:Uncharacterized protein n=1 Tax=Entamoeba invadens IP1 TaxID=370355 RepID=L7FNQ5_ENTIV|nr:hypothetical protein EIN_187930 [Entamoeba invadens IP1]ELP92399.1 hypothetical protein EIN_187930 [Entamoeba invadens IP1]|eukprot:XP_004259170.1 hypothetical protein EIN_187930 [Entamoeba invadens IP1]
MTKSEQKIPESWEKRITLEPKQLLQETRGIISASGFQKLDQTYCLGVLLFHSRLLLFHTTDKTYEPMKSIPTIGNMYNPQNRYEEVLLSLNFIEVIVKDKDILKLAQTPIFVYSVLVYTHCHMETLLIRLFERLVVPLSQPIDRWVSFALLMVSSSFTSQALPIISTLTTRPVCWHLFPSLKCSFIIRYSVKIDLTRSFPTTFLHSIGRGIAESAGNQPITALTDLLPLVKSSSLARYHVALLYAELRKPQIALKVLRPLLSVPLPSMATYRLAVLILTSMKQIDVALSTLKVAKQRYPNDVFLRVCQLRLQPTLKNLEETFSSFKFDVFDQTKMLPSILPSVGSDAMSSGRVSISGTAASGLSAMSFVQSKLYFTDKISAFSIIGKTFPASLWKEAAIIFEKEHMKEDLRLALEEGIRVSSYEHSIELDKMNGLEPVIPSDFEILRTELVEEIDVMGKMDLLERAKKDGNEKAILEIAKENLKKLDKNACQNEILNLDLYLSKQPFDGTAWELMGSVFEFLEQNEKAQDCYEIAIKLNDTKPVLPFSCIEKNASLF